LIWGTDFVSSDALWGNALAKKYKSTSGVQNPIQLRRNAYRVLLTRGREGLIICLPQFLSELDETFNFFVNAGCTELR
jgi:hypothetical protein